MVETRNRDRAKALLARAAVGVADEYIDLIVDVCVDEFKEHRYPPPPPGTLALMIPQLYWVIRDDDLKAFEAFWKAAAAAASTNMLAGSITGSAAVGLVAAAFGVYRQVRTKGVSLTIDQCQVLRALMRVDRPVLAQELTRDTDFTVEDLEKVLISLAAVRCDDGTITAVVARDPENRWAPSGI
jgi:hypothetical protein